MNNRNLILSMVAGLAGGALSTYFWPAAVRAQSAAPEEIRARCFTLVNADGVALGSFSFDDLGRPQIVLRDHSGHDVWKLVGDHVSNAGSGRFQSK